MRATEHALELRHRFFENLIDSLPLERIRRLVSNVQNSDVLPEIDSERCYHSGSKQGVPLYQNADERQKLDFRVERLPFGADVLDPRVVHIPAGKGNELHKHAHETVIHVMSGEARVRVGEQYFDARQGDTLFVPRWALHQVQNTGSSALSYFAVTDFGFASKAHSGDYLHGHRQKRENDGIFAG
jgi:quercetin dioxygenase-like cupin family protein